MFDFLKKKVQSFTEKIKNVIEKKEEKLGKKPIAEGKPAEEIPEIKQKPQIEKEIEEKAKESEAEEETVSQEIPESIVEIKRTKDLRVKEEDKRELKAKKSLKTTLISVFAKEVKIEEADVKDFLFEFELAMLESDVEQDTAKAIIENIRKELVGKKASKKTGLSEFLKQEIKNSLKKVMQVPELNFWKIASEKKPLKVMFLGPNGAGKTTTIAKLAHLMQKKGKKVILASSDTFRAGSIEQIEKHAEKLGIRVVKHNYGADPAAVAFDAVKAAEAGKADAVFIDTAGRQETNKNLMQELKKIARVIKPDLKIYVGESFTGQALLQQAREFDKEIGIDGFILTKIDTDAKGGTAISLLYKLKKPIIFIGTGQGYEDLIEFKPEFIIDRIV